MTTFKKDSGYLRLETFLFWGLIGLLLYPILSNSYFLTGDGPCHLYNSKVLLDFLTETNVDFYSGYYNLNNNTEPNWFSHVVLAGLLTLFSDASAEKILLVVYVLVFSISLRGVISNINKENRFLVFVGLPFVFHRMVQMGFYNFSFGFAFCFLGIWFWLANRHRLNWYRVLVFALINLLTYFTHPIGFLLSGLIIGSIAVGEFILSKAGKVESGRTSFSTFKNILIGFLPGILLMFEYLGRKGINATPNPDSTKELYHEFLELTSLVNLSDKEELLAMMLAILIGILVIYSVVEKIRTKTLTVYDGIFGAFVLMLYIYFNQPGSMAGAGILSVRLQFMPYLVVLLWLAANKFHPILKKATALIAIGIVVSFSAIRIPIHKLASEATEEYVSVREHIPSGSTVLPLSYAHNGKTPEGEQVSDQIWLFMHAADYMGSDRSIVMFGNYEANTGYFPIIWKDSRNPYKHLSKGYGLEHLPPGVDISRYEKDTGGQVDFVITWCLDDQFLNRPETQDVLKQLDEGYQLVFSSQNQLAHLYKRKSPDTNQ